MDSPAPLRCLELFAGVGGQALGLRATGIVKTVAYCEICPHARSVLQDNMAGGGLEEGPIFTDVRALSARKLRTAGAGRIDMIAGGFPCQDISSMGARKGLMGGQRSVLVLELLRLAEECQAKILFLENVAPIVQDPHFHRQLLKRCDALGYDCFYELVAASQVGASHRRKRWFMVCVRRSKRSILGKYKLSPAPSDTLARMFRQAARCTLERSRETLAIAKHQSKFMGNAVVPAQAEAAFRRLWTTARNFYRSPQAGRCEISPRRWEATRRAPTQYCRGCFYAFADASLPVLASASTCANGNFKVTPPRGTNPGVRDWVPQNKKPLLSKSFTATCAPTPRTSPNTSLASPSLTSRTRNDLGAFLLSTEDFRREYLSRTRPSDLRRLQHMVSPHYLCALMGFPKRWLDAFCARKANEVQKRASQKR